MIELSGEQHLGKKALILFTLEKMKWAFLILAATIAISILKDMTKLAILGKVVSALTLITILAVIITLFVSWLEYRQYSFSFGEFDLNMKSGVVSKKEISIPYRQIRSIDIERSVSHQLLGLSKLTLLTGGHEESNEEHMSEVVLEPIEHDLTEAIRDLLQSKVGVQIVKEASEVDK